MTIILSVLAFNFIVFVHEAGHYIAARLSGIKVVEFAIGMGPKLFSTAHGETVYSIRAFPIGGFCLMLGEDEENKDPRAFNSKPIGSRMAAIAAAPFVNILLAVLIYSLVIMPTTVISQVGADRPAQRAGLVAGDRITEINGVKIDQWEQIKPEVAKYEGITIPIKVENKGKSREVTVTPVRDPETKDVVIGIAPAYKVGGVSLLDGIKTTAYITKAMYGLLGQLVIGKANSNDIGGPISILVYMNDAAKSGLLNLLYLTAIISLNLAVLNLLPIPAMDGGRLFFLFIELIRKKPVAAEREGMVHFVGFVALMVLAVFLMYRDIVRLNILNMFR